MKKLMLTSILALLVMTGNALKAQDRADEYLGLPGDNLNLYAVMNLFQETETLETFEKKLNDPESRINNLDLNGDNFVDYIMVSDYPDNDVHNIVLQVALSPNEKQDVAVFTVQRFSNGSVQIQLIGDEALYGRNYIVEPIYAETPNPGYRGRARRNVNVYTTDYYEVAAWPVVRFIYQPYYTVWHSSWYWGYYPSYWRAWTPFYWHYYYGYHRNYYPMYHSHYRHWSEPRYSGYHDFYYTRMRSHSPTVVVNINKGHYKNTYSRPESRRDGEALYARTHSERASTSTSRRNTAVSPDSRRNTTTSRSATSRRSTEAVSAGRSSGQTKEVSRRTSPTVNQRSSSDRNTVTKSTGSRRSTATESNRNVRQQQSTERSSTEVRSTRSSGPNTGISGRSETVTRSPRTISSAGRSSGNTMAARSSSGSAERREAVSRPSGSTSTRSSSASAPSRRETVTRSNQSTTRQSTSTANRSASSTRKSTDTKESGNSRSRR